MYTINLNDEFIKLGQALKAAGLVSSGVEAKIVIINGEVKVNGEVELQRGKKLRDGDVVSYNGEEIKIVG
ncbi:MAG: RNA-binding S4 domain-containing protein [Clostridiales bacterium]|jgi:ribosome-associated protein|uniref:RNA-binding S4 domain-containing protein n=1 Tax=Bovifimicola ammoniilytica TaxID=2981720 RepID=UPI00033D0FF9|nr:RNA-binding S4 domain-containing protein [Bovifimicola ammoniilytica]MBD8942366.1 RNA-binding S4 domain-containing protein [Clostridiales bacterium]MDD6292384.1 RNA-binding S4 domain-containing protein [Eubacteriales bacterium]MDY2607643.1 RNA-binding S4 domain-containing protein [Lachnospiraceae bacterium]CCZ05017.1 s4 domain protein [Eubacterium sp. CAG:603]SCJ84090.1 ribosome-associated protein [uncultured Eubacterium sp.]